MSPIKCDDCKNDAGIYVCTGCYEKVKNQIPGLKTAIRIAESRLATAKAINYNYTDELI